LNGTLITNSTFVICSDCGSSIYADDAENIVRVEENGIWLRCRNNCCGRVARYTPADLLTRPQGQTTDHTSRIFLEI
jgi:hypothetical protein